MKIMTQVPAADGTMKAVEVEVSDEQVQAAGFMPASKFQEELTRRGTSIAQKAGYVKPDEMTPEQIKALAEQKGVKLPVEADPGTMAATIQEATTKKRTEWETTELKPVQTKVQELETENETLLQKQLHSQILAAAAAVGVEKTLLKAPNRNSPPPIVSMLESAFGYDTDTKQFYVLSDDGEGFAFSDKPTEEHPYKDPAEFLELWAANKDNAKFIEVTAQRGPNLQGVITGRPGMGPVHLSRADSRNARAIEAAKAEAVKRGLDPYNGGVVYDS